MCANQLRLWFASMAYVLLSALRRIVEHKALWQRTGKITVDELVSAKHEGHKY